MNTQMHLKIKEIDNSSLFTAKSKQFSIIVLADNRCATPTTKDKDKNLKGSACKETELDSHQFLTGSSNYNDQDDIIVFLTKRIIQLEKKVQVLSKSEKSESNIEKKQEKKLNKKNRRKFQQIIRDNCPHCQKVYGSDTALKYHLKLKHSLSHNHSQSQ